MTLRRRAALAVLVPVLLATLVACQPGRRDPASIERILVVGDSIAHGAYAAPGFIPQLQQFYPNAQIVALGGPSSSPTVGYVPGTVHSDWSGQVNHWLSIGFDADLVIIQGCCNGSTSSATWRGALDALVARSRGFDPGNDRRVVLVTTPAIVPGSSPYFEAAGVDDMIQMSNAVIRQTPNVALADLDFAWSVNWGPSLVVPNIGTVRYIDNFHLNTTGALEAARFISRY